MFRDGHEKVRAVVAARPAGGEWRGVRAPPGRRALQRRPLGGRLRRRPDRALGVHDPRLDRRLRHLARRAAAQARGGRDGARERDQRGRDPARGGRPARRGPRPAADRARAPHPRRRRDPRGGQARRRDGHGAVRRRGAPRRALRAERARAVAGARGRPGAGAASAPGTSSSRAPGAGCKGVQEQLPRLAELGFDVIYLPPIHPIGQTNRKGRNNALVAAPDDPGSPWAIGDGDGRPRRRPPRAGHARGRARAVRGRGRARARHRARPRDQRLGQSPVAQGAPRVVPPPARRHDQVRREPAQEVPGHLQRQLGHGRLAGAVGRAAADHARVGRARREGVPGRQPAHEADPVLGVADRARSTRSTATSSSWPRPSPAGR